jgi:hypothetical protein
VDTGLVIRSDAMSVGKRWLVGVVVIALVALSSSAAFAAELDLQGKNKSTS